MAINNPLIPGDPFSYDLKWIVMKIKWLVQQGASLETALEALRSYVDQRFDDLDIQDEVNQKLSEMYEDGSLALLIARYLNINTPQLHGAVGDGETDDTAAIQAAIDTGIPVFIPDGRYLITDTLKVTRSNTKIYGDIDSAIIIGDELKEGNDAKWALQVYSDQTPVKKLVTSAITEGGTSFTVNNGDDLEKDMIVMISGDFSTSPWTSYNRGSITKGETNLVNAISGSTVTIAVPASIPFATSEIVTAEFIEPVKNVLLENLTFIGKDDADDKRQYRGATIINGVDCVVQGCKAFNCGINSFELAACVWSRLTNCYVKDAWSYEDGTTNVIGLGYALRDNGCNSCRIENSVVDGARHGVDISGNYPAVNTIVRENTLRAGTSVAVLNTHGSAFKSEICNNLIYGGTNLSGEKIVFRENRATAVVRTSYGRNFILEGNSVPYFGLGLPDVNEPGNYIIIRGNILTGTQICTINAGENGPYETVYGFMCEDNKLIISSTSNIGVICNITYSQGATVTFARGLVTNNNISFNQQSYTVNPLALTNNMAITNVGLSEWDSVISNGLFVAVNVPSTNTIGARAYRSRLKVPVWYDGANWLKADATAP